MQKMTEKAMREANGGKWRWYCSVCHKGGYTLSREQLQHMQVVTRATQEKELFTSR